MKKSTPFAVVIFFLLILSGVGCKSILGPDKGKLVIDGSITITMTDYGRPMFQGYVKNTGESTVYNSKVEISVYSDAAKTTIIDTANGFPADLGDIPAGVRAYFEAVCFDLTDPAQIVAYTTQITWLDKD